MEFDHFGLVTDEKKANEDWVEATRVWVTDPKTHPYHIEWLRYEPDTPVTGAVREKPHLAFRVDDIESAAKGMKVLIEPWDVGGFVRVGFFESDDGAVIEFMQYLGDPNAWFEKKHD